MVSNMCEIFGLNSDVYWTWRLSGYSTWTFCSVSSGLEFRPEVVHWSFSWFTADPPDNNTLRQAATASFHMLTNSWYLESPYNWRPLLNHPIQIPQPLIWEFKEFKVFYYCTWSRKSKPIMGITCLSLCQLKCFISQATCISLIFGISLNWRKSKLILVHSDETQITIYQDSRKWLVTQKHVFMKNSPWALSSLKSVDFLAYFTTVYIIWFWARRSSTTSEPWGRGQRWTSKRPCFHVLTTWRGW
jgi:hypothetical protein